jgi:hypothetical protein
VTADAVRAMCRALCHVLLEAARSEPSDAALGEYLHELGTHPNPLRFPLCATCCWRHP